MKATTMPIEDTQTNPDASAMRKTIAIHGPSLFKNPAELKRLGGSQNDDWNNVIANQTVNTIRADVDEGENERQFKAIASALCEINPNDPMEAMIAAQLLAGHNAAMECYRRAMAPNQTFEWRREHLTQANKLSRTCTMLLDSLNRHRGKGQQKVTVEHVHVHKGGQAIVGSVETPGGGFPSKLEVQPHAKQIANPSQPPMRSTNEERELMPVTLDAKRALSNARRNVIRRAKGK